MVKKTVLYPLSHSAIPFYVCVGYFPDRLSRTISLGWLQIAPPDLCQLVVRITGMNHRCQVRDVFY
jgi:hypothetical protein